MAKAEIEIWRKLQSPNIVKFIDSKISEEEVIILSELCPGGTLIEEI
jgi:serine/threonine protein kinase